MICCGSGFKDVNISNMQYLPVEVKINNKPYAIIDTSGRFLSEQVEKSKKAAQDKIEGGQ